MLSFEIFRPNLRTNGNYIKLVTANIGAVIMLLGTILDSGATDHPMKISGVFLSALWLQGGEKLLLFLWTK